MRIETRETVDQSCGMEPRTQLKIHEFLKQMEDETENLTESSNHINKNWINTAKVRGRWTPPEENYTKNSVTRTRRNSHNRPARYVNGVTLNDEEIADIT